jgi:serine/threonine-protein kinase
LNYEPGQEGKQKSDNREGVVGTPHFIAPESLQHSAKTDARSDLYMVGAVGYFLLTGRHVFEGGSFKEVCHKHIHEPPVAPGTRLGRPLCAQLEGIILRCLKKQPDARPQSAVELAHLLEACPEAGVWTVEQRRIWWTAYRTASKQDLGAKARPITPTEATVKIEFAGRAA